MKARLLLGLLAFGLLVSLAQGATNLPPAPTRYVTDAAGILDAQTVSALNATLDKFERETSNQVVVAILPQLPEGMALEDYTQQVSAAWKAGSKKNNGVVLFIFPKEHRIRIEVGYGLEGALPDALAREIIATDLQPAFKRGDYNYGVTHGVHAILDAIRGEYQGAGQTQADRVGAPEDVAGLLPSVLPLAFFGLIVLLIVINSARRGTTYTSSRRYDPWPISFGGGSSSSGSSWGGSSGGNDSGGSFSGGGGDFGGGGASGSW